MSLPQAARSIIRLGIPVFDERVGEALLGSIETILGDDSSHVHLFNYIVAKTWSDRGERIVYILDKQIAEPHRSIAESMGISVRILEEGGYWSYIEVDNTEDAISNAIEHALRTPLVILDSTTWFDPSTESLINLARTLSTTRSIVLVSVISSNADPKALAQLQALSDMVIQLQTDWVGVRVSRIIRLLRSRIPRPSFAAYYSISKEGIKIEELKRL